MPQYPSSETLFRVSPNAYLLLGRDGLVADANAAYLQRVVRDAPSMVGRRIQDVFATDLQLPQAEVDDCLASIARVSALGVADSLSVTSHVVEGKRRCWRLTHTPIPDSRGNTESILQWIESVSEAPYGEQNPSALRQAHRLEDFGKLTGGIAHDFNNMLQIIGGNLQLLRRSLVADQAAQRRLESASSGVDMATRLASQLLAFASRQPLQPRWVDFGEMLGRMDGLSGGGALTFRLDIQQGLWPLFADAGHLQGMILRLVANARAAMAGRGVLNLRARNCPLDDAQLLGQPGVKAGRYVEICVIDEGEGMSQEVLEQAFEPFFTTRRSAGASGMGLSEVYGFVRQSGGFVVLESEESRGTCVRVYLPADAERAEDSFESIEPARQGSPIAGHVVEGSSTSLKILFVEDDPTLRMLTGEVMDELGHAVCLCESAEDALEQLEQQRFDVLLTDVGLAGMSGIELVRMARERDATLSVVIASGYEVDVRKEGLDGLRTMLKPYDIHQVRSLLERIREERMSAGY